jgi:hypothetical protein
MTAWKHVSVLVVSCVVCCFLNKPAFSAPAREPAIDDEDWSGCADAAQAVERQGRAPAFILAALTETESGRRAPGGSVRAWPWTIHAKGRGHYYASKDAAIAAVRRLHAQGVTTIDVGCAQINLRYHPNAFASLEEAFDPVTNISYALQFLRELHARFGSWEDAIASYHSIDPSHQTVYRKRVLSAWLKAERDDAEFWSKSDVHPAPSDRPGNDVFLARDATDEPALSPRQSRQAWTRWEGLTPRSRLALVLASASRLPVWVPDLPRPAAPGRTELALDLGARPRAKVKRRCPCHTRRSRLTPQVTPRKATLRDKGANWSGVRGLR